MCFQNTRNILTSLSLFLSPHLRRSTSPPPLTLSALTHKTKLIADTEIDRREAKKKDGAGIVFNFSKKLLVTAFQHHPAETTHGALKCQLPAFFQPLCVILTVILYVRRGCCVRNVSNRLRWCFFGRVYYKERRGEERRWLLKRFVFFFKDYFLVVWPLNDGTLRSPVLWRWCPRLLVQTHTHTETHSHSKGISQTHTHTHRCWHTHTRRPWSVSSRCQNAAVVFRSKGEKKQWINNKR